MKPGCNELIENRSFESGLDPWRTLGRTVESVEVRGSPPDGQKVAVIYPDKGKGAFLESPQEAMFASADVSTITLSFSLMVGTGDPLPKNDFFSVTVVCHNSTDCFGSLGDSVYSTGQDEAPRSWKRVTVDITKLLTHSTRGSEWHLSFGALESFVNQSFWYIDDVSVQACTR